MKLNPYCRFYIKINITYIKYINEKGKTINRLKKSYKNILSPWCRKYFLHETATTHTHTKGKYL